MDDDDGPPGVPEWVVTYGDMMSLLLTFFIMLVSMSEVSQKSKYREVLASLHERMGYTSGAQAAPGMEYAGTSSNSPEAEAGVPPVSDPGDGGTPRPTSPGLRPVLTREHAGRPVLVDPPVTFEPNDVRPAAGGEAALDALAEAIAGKPQRIELRGFAPPEGDRVTNDLAYRRARFVLEELIRRGVRPGRFRLRTGGFAAEESARDFDAPPRDRVEVWVLDRLAVDPGSGH